MKESNPTHVNTDYTQPVKTSGHILLVAHLAPQKQRLCGRNCGMGLLQDSAGAGRAPRKEQSSQQQPQLRGFPFNGLVFVLYIRKTVNNKYCVIGPQLPLAPPAVCRGEGHSEWHREGCWHQLYSWEVPSSQHGHHKAGQHPSSGSRMESGTGDREVTLCRQHLS